jgi:hypothetical protein
MGSLVAQIHRDIVSPHHNIKKSLFVSWLWIHVDNYLNGNETVFIDSDIILALNLVMYIKSIKILQLSNT